MAVRHARYTLYIPAPFAVWGKVQALAESVADALGVEGATITNGTGLWKGRCEGLYRIEIVAPYDNRNRLLVDSIMVAYGQASEQEQVLYTVEEIEACFVDL